MMKRECITEYVLSDPVNPFTVDDDAFSDEDVAGRVLPGEVEKGPYSYNIYYTDGCSASGYSTIEPDEYIEMIMKGVLHGDPQYLEIDTVCGCGFDESGKPKDYFTYSNDSFKLRNLAFPFIGKADGYSLDDLSDGRKYLYLSYLIQEHKPELEVLFHLEEEDLDKLQSVLVKAQEDAKRLQEEQAHGCL